LRTIPAARLTLAAASLLWSFAAAAMEDQSSGTYWKTVCDQPKYDDICGFYIYGLVDGLKLAVTDSSPTAVTGVSKVYGYCPPQKITVLDMKTAFKQYLKDHPEQLKYRGASLALEAWKRKWPCPK
jgi:hypothetical protein